MRLTAVGDDICDLDGVVGEALTERLAPGGARPVAVALSGGGDSVALTLAACAWAERAGRGLIILTVDHGLQAQSAGWTQACRARAAALGADFRALAWTGAKPSTGLPAAARAARHRLLAEAAREAGAQVILMGHTADDVAEARAMRAAGATTPEPRVWAPSPAWPEGRGVFLMRPLLGVGRAAIRRWLVAQGESWIEDPANADLRYARARARKDGAQDPGPPQPAADPAPVAAAATMDWAGVLSLPRQALRRAGEHAARAFVGMACLCAAGTSRPAGSARVRRLCASLAGEDAVTATLAGARIEADEVWVRFLREAGETARGGLAPLEMAPGAAAVWDGRFEIAADQAIEVRPLKGLAAGLRPAERARLAELPASARPSLPVAVRADGVRLIAARPLALERLRAACGLIAREPA